MEAQTQVVAGRGEGCFGSGCGGKVQPGDVLTHCSRERES